MFSIHECEMHIASKYFRKLSACWISSNLNMDSTGTFHVKCLHLPMEFLSPTVWQCNNGKSREHFLMYTLLTNNFFTFTTLYTLGIIIGRFLYMLIR